MKTNDELIEEKARVLIAPGIGVRYLTEEDVRTILTQKDAEVATMLHKLHLCSIGKYDGDALENVKEQIREFQALTPHPTEDTSDKTDALTK